MEISVIFIPCIMVVKSRKLQKETIQQLIDWERNHGSGTSVDTGSTYVPTLDGYRLPSPAPSSGPIRSELYSMKALEKALATNTTPLLRFSALKDFSGENISFLKHVHDWKATWTAAASQQPPPPRFPLTRKSNKLPALLDNETLRRHQFTFAVEIYVSFISPQYSDFPINISCAQLKDLESIFCHAASTLNARVQENPATPFDSFPCPLTNPDDVEQNASAAAATGCSGTPVSPIHTRDKDSISIASTAVNTATSPTYPTIHGTGSNSDPGLTPLSALPTFSLLELKPRLNPDIAIPLSFGPHVLDEAESAVKYVVLTNTWPKFVAAGFSSQGEREREREREDKRGRREGGGEKGGCGDKGEGGWARWCWDWVSSRRGEE